MKKIFIKRIYAAPDKKDGKRILVDRLWPRGISGEKAKIDYWLKEIAPSSALRKSFSHEIGKWEEFRSEYLKELKKLPAGIIEKILAFAERDDITLLFAARDEEHNNAVVLKEFLEKHILN